MGFKHIMFSLCIIFFVENSNQFNINISRRNIITKTLLANSLANINNNIDNIDNNDNINYIKNIDKKIKKLYLDDSEDNESEKYLLSNNNFKSKSPLYNNNIYFTGALNEETCFRLTEALIEHKNNALTSQYHSDHINLYLQSPGGALLPTLAVVDEILNLGIPVYTYIRGYAASAATLLSVVGSRRYMYNHSVMMIHGVKLNEHTSSSLLDVKDLNYNVDVFMNIIKNIYYKHTNIDSSILEELFYHDIWMNSSKALQYGLIDEII